MQTLLTITAGNVGRTFVERIREANLTPTLNVDILDHDEWSDDYVDGLIESTAAQLVVCVADRPYPTIFRTVNRRAIAAGAIAVYGMLKERRIVVGPTVLPKQTACFDCYLVRFLSNSPSRRVDLPVFQHFDRNPSVRMKGELAPLNALAAGMIAAEVRRVAGGNHDNGGYVVTYDPLRFDSNRNFITPVPWCTTCGAVAEPTEQTFAHLAEALGTFVTDREGNHAES